MSGCLSVNDAGRTIDRASTSGRRPANACERPGRATPRDEAGATSCRDDDGPDDSLVDVDAAPLAAHYFNYRKTSIYGGSNEIQKNIIAQMILGI